MKFALKFDPLRLAFGLLCIYQLGNEWPM